MPNKTRIFTKDILLATLPKVVDILHKTTKKIPKIHLEAQKHLKSQSDPEQEQYWSQYLISNYAMEPW
jgi:hypothetical protein